LNLKLLTLTSIKTVNLEAKFLVRTKNIFYYLITIN
jgi:hypothetical protein